MAQQRHRWFGDDLRTFLNRQSDFQDYGQIGDVEQFTRATSASCVRLDVSGAQRDLCGKC